MNTATLREYLRQGAGLESLVEYGERWELRRRCGCRNYACYGQLPDGTYDGGITVIVPCPMHRSGYRQSELFGAAA